MVAAADAPSFDADVRPILETHCLDCHGRETLDGGVGLDSFYHASQPTDAGEALVVPGRPGESVLLRVLTLEDDEHRMPKYGDRLGDAEVAAVRDWIAADGRWPDDGWRPPTHWAFVPPEKSPPPEVPAGMLEGRDANAIDRFVAARLHAEGLAMNPPADPARLLRRVHLDLVGLPPTVEEVDAFVADPSFARYARVVDRLLASPEYGERWAVQWLDLARYADSEGYQRDSPRSMWAYRDWVIDALNADVPFDEFTIEQLAGDLLPDATPDQVVATAFHRNAPTNIEAGTDPAEDRYKVIVDRVNTTGTVWLGLTVGCAQCHNHKYDPISAKEYYELYAFFDKAPMETKQQGDQMGMSGLEPIGPTVPVALSPAEEERLTREQKRLDEALRETEAKARQLVAARVEKSPETAEKNDKRTTRLLKSDDPWTAGDVSHVLQKSGVGKGRVPGLAELIETEQRLKRWREKTVRVMADADPDRMTYVATRGDFMSQGVQVSPATPLALHPMDESLPRNRLGLAKWLVDPANPLVARAFVNRLWVELFGQGLMTTPGDFGTQSAPPSHPELLDDLAVRFMTEDEWSMKRAVRRIVLSATYRQSASVRPEAAEVDPRNQLLWRHPGHRLSAEVIRDNALAVSGLLVRGSGGPAARPFQPDGVWRKTAGAGEEHYAASAGPDAHRRGVYTLWRRNAHYPSFAAFDAPDRTACTVQRDVSNTPLQALALLNDPVYVEMAEAFGRRIEAEGGPTIDDQLRWAFRTTLAREPTAEETAVLREAFDAAGYGEVATILLNLHETIHRP